MKNLLLICLILLPLFVSAQIMVERSVFSSLGSSNSGDLSIDATYGESSIGLFKDGKYQLTIGFHQSVDIIDHIIQADDVVMTIYPNPTHNTINISSSNKIDKIDLLSLSGTTIYQFNQIQKDQTKVDISQLVKGMYILQITTTEGQIKQEQIIVH